MSLRSDIYMFWIFLWESFYNFWRWTPFGPKKCKFEGRLDGKTAIVTGANSGIGREVARFLALKGARVILACRDLKKAGIVADELQKECVSGKIEVRHCNLASLASVRQLAKELEHEPQIDILVNNAGVMMCPFDKTVDGNETHFAVNHLGHFLLTMLLMDKLKKSPQARIINVTSTSFYRTCPNGINFDDINYNSTNDYSPHLAYARSKLANVLFTRELAKRLQGTNVHVYVAYPGNVRTNLSRYITGFYGFIWKIAACFVFRKPELGAQTIIFCATDKETGRENGHYYDDCTMSDKKLPTVAIDEQAQQRLWNLSCDLTGINTTL